MRQEGRLITRAAAPGLLFLALLAVDACPAEPASPAAVPSRATSASATLDLASLESRLKGTKAIGVFTKLALKNQVDDLLEQFREFHDGRAEPTLSELRESYDLLLLKVLSLLQDKDARLARDLVASREAIWGVLMDPAKFGAL